MQNKMSGVDVEVGRWVHVVCKHVLWDFAGCDDRVLQSCLFFWEVVWRVDDDAICVYDVDAVRRWALHDAHGGFDVERVAVALAGDIEYKHLVHEDQV